MNASASKNSCQHFGLEELAVRKKRRERRPAGALFDDYLTRHDLQRRLGVSRQTIGRMDKAGKLPRSIMFNGVHLYKRQEIEQWEKELLTELKNRKNNNNRK
jgi:hypothetical protein